MNRFCLFIAVLLIVGCGPSKFVQETQPRAAGYRIKYDHQALKIPGKEFAIGLTVPGQGRSTDTIGFPGKDGGWGKYHIEVDSGRFSGGRIKLRKSNVYKKDDSVAVNVYQRKWFLGGRGRFLVSRKIPYNFEDSIAVIADGNSDRFPGGHIRFGVRTYYNNKQYAELWYPVKKKNRDDFLLGFEGGHLSRKKGDWKVDPDPTRIKNDQVKLFATLAKAPAIRDTLGLLLNYKSRFQCNILSADDGHELDVTVDAFDDTIIQAKLLRIEVRDSMTHRSYHYLVNIQGGSMNISSSGANGEKGEDGQSGADGRDGADGVNSQMPVTSVDTAGHTITTYVDVQGPGGDGDNGGDGGDGGIGYIGGDGGNITIYYTSSAASYLKMIMASSFPGAGGSGGDGGAGGRGGNGGNGNPPGRPGRRGTDGASGSRGDDGRPGIIRFVER